MPFNLQSIVTKIGPNGDPKIEEQIIGYEGCTKELKDYSKIAVIYAIKQLTGYHKKISNIRKVIRVCLVEMRNHPELQADIVTAAKTKARLMAAEKRSQFQDMIEGDMVAKDFLLQTKEQFGVDAFNTNVEDLPSNDEELQLYMQLN